MSSSYNASVAGRPVLCHPDPAYRFPTSDDPQAANKTSAHQNPVSLSPNPASISNTGCPVSCTRTSVVVIGDSSSVAHETLDTDVIGVASPETGDERVYRIVTPRAGGSIPPGSNAEHNSQSRHSARVSLSDTSAHVRMRHYVQGSKGGTEGEQEEEEAAATSMASAHSASEWPDAKTVKRVQHHRLGGSRSTTPSAHPSPAFFRGDSIDEMMGSATALGIAVATLSPPVSPRQQNLGSCSSSAFTSPQAPPLISVEAVGVSTPEMAEYYALNAQHDTDANAANNVLSAAGCDGKRLEASGVCSSHAAEGAQHKQTPLTLTSSDAVVAKVIDEQARALSELLQTVRTLTEQNAHLETRVKALESQQAGREASSNASTRLSGMIDTSTTPTREPSKAPAH